MSNQRDVKSPDLNIVIVLGTFVVLSALLFAFLASFTFVIKDKHNEIIVLPQGQTDARETAGTSSTSTSVFVERPIQSETSN